MEIVVEDAISKHDNSTYPPGTIVSGTVNVINNGFVSIEGLKIMVKDDTMEIPLHNYTPVSKHSHSYPITYPTGFQQLFVTVEGKQVVLLSDVYSADHTWIDYQGTNGFVTI